MKSRFRACEEACKRKVVRIGKMFGTENLALEGPHWLINFPSEMHWRQPSKREWIVEGRQDLRRVIEVKKFAVIA